MRRAAAVLVGAAILSAAAAPVFATAGDPVTGYWARTRTGLPVPLEPLEPVPDGGTWVASDPSGPVAVSALRIDLAAGLVAVELRVTVARAVGTPAVQACPTTDRWAPEQGGRLEGAPIGDCSAPLVARIDGTSLVVGLPAGLGTVNVLLRPVPGSAFSLTMERATAATVITAPAPDPFVAPPPAQGPPPETTSSGPAFGSTGAPGFVPPPLDLPAQPPLFAAPVPSTAGSPAPAPQAAPVLARRAAAVPPDDRTQALLAVGMLVLLGAQAIRLAQQPAVAPKTLGGGARRRRPAPTEMPDPSLGPARGVGRFRVARTGPPVRL